MTIIEGDVTAELRWSVYGLADAKTPEEPFYIGLTRHPSVRFGTHRRADTPAGERFREIEAAGGKVVMSIFFETDDGAKAARVEVEQIVAHPGVLNLRRGRVEYTRQIAASLPVSLIRLLQEEQAARGLDSMSAAIRALLEEALKP